MAIGQGILSGPVCMLVAFNSGLPWSSVWLNVYSKSSLSFRLMDCSFLDVSHFLRSAQSVHKYSAGS